MSAIDAMFGLGGLIVVFLLCMLAFSILYEKPNQAMDRRSIEMRSYYAMEQIMSRGDPSNWHRANVSNYGISYEPGILDVEKILALNSSVAANSSAVAERLGIGGYNFSLEIRDFYNHTVLYEMGGANSGRILRLERVSTINGTLVSVVLKVAG